MKVITLLNEKGGVGKTAVTAHLAAGLAIRGYRVIAIDADPQGHLALRFGIKKTDGLFRLLAQEAEWGNVMTPPLEKHWAGDYVIEGALSIVPGNRLTRLLPVALENEPKALLKKIRGDHEEPGLADYADIVLIDTSPQPGGMHTVVSVATDYILHPTETQYLSLDGLAASVKGIQELNATRRESGIQEPVQMLGIIPVKYRENTSAHKYGLDLLNESFAGRVLPSLALRTAWVDSEYEQRTLFSYAPESAAADEMWAVVDAVQQRLNANYYAQAS